MRVISGVSPQLEVPGSFTVYASAVPIGASYELPEAAGGSVTCDPAPNAPIGEGPNDIECTATYPDTVPSEAGFVITVVLDDADPVIGPIVPVTQVSPDGTATAVQFPTLDITDDTPTTVTCDRPGDHEFPVGNHTVNCTVTDSAGNDAEASFEVSIIDGSPVQSISVSTDAGQYTEGDTISITGNVSLVAEGIPMTLEILSGTTTVHIDSADVAQDGSFSASIMAVLQNPGEYTIIARYPDGMAQASFTYSLAPDRILYSIDEDRHAFDVYYAITGASINNMTIDPESSRLTIQMQASDDGYIELELPREAIGATDLDGSDAEFTVRVDGSAVRYAEEQGDSEYRKISIDFASGASEIVITGTYLNKSGSVCGISLEKSTLTFTLVQNQTTTHVMQSIISTGMNNPNSITIAAQPWTGPLGTLDGYVTEWKHRSDPDSAYEPISGDGTAIYDNLPKSIGESLAIDIRVNGMGADSSATTGAMQTISYVVEC